MNALRATALIALGACSATPALSPDAMTAGTEAGPSDASVEVCGETGVPVAISGGLLVDFASASLRSVGTACAFGPQCASGLCSSSVSSGACGVCLEQRRLGQTCGGAAQGCSRSAVCRDGICQTMKKPLGASCRLQPKGGDLFDCDDELYCSGTSGQGTCAERLALGVACAPLAVCVPGALCSNGVCTTQDAASCALRGCGQGQYCGTVDSVATCQAGTLAIGARCGIVDGSFVDNGCAATAVCGSRDFPNGGGGPATVETCLPAPGEGEVCINDVCAAGLFCRYGAEDCSGTIDRRCARLGQEGEACASFGLGRDEDMYLSSCAPQLECRAGRCQQPCR
jgi:hypothetical protein